VDLRISREALIFICIAVAAADTDGGEAGFFIKKKTILEMSRSISCLSVVEEY
jgi:hypothetical protein